MSKKKKAKSLTKDQAIIEVGELANSIRKIGNGIFWAIVIFGIAFILLAAYLLIIAPAYEKWECENYPEICTIPAQAQYIPEKDTNYLKCIIINEERCTTTKRFENFQDLESYLKIPNLIMTNSCSNEFTSNEITRLICYES